jgi:hypothetical protein
MVNTYHPEPHNIYNVDETGFRIEATGKCYMIIDKEQGSTGYLGEGARGEALTVIECGCANGTERTRRLITKEINKAASTAFTDRAILSAYVDDMRAHNKEKDQNQWQWWNYYWQNRGRTCTSTATPLHVDKHEQPGLERKSEYLLLRLPHPKITHYVWD